MPTEPETRMRHARRSLIAWYAQIPIVLVLSAAAAWEAWVDGTPYQAAVLVYLALISVWTGIESGHARLNADLPSG